MIPAGYPGNECTGMFVGPVTSELLSIVNDFMLHFKVPYDYHVGIMSVDKDTTLPWHNDTPDSDEYQDYALLCAINHIIEPDNPEPVQFKDNDNNIYEYEYTTALLNIQEQHRVINGANDRKVLRIFFISGDATYENVREIFNTH